MSKNERRQKTVAQLEKARRKWEIDQFLGGWRGLPSNEEPTGGARHQSPPKVGTDGIPRYERSLISPEAMAILQKKK